MQDASDIVYIISPHRIKERTSHLFDHLILTIKGLETRASV